MKKKVFIAVNSMAFGGIQKSLLSFLEYIKDKAEIDMLVWHDYYELQLPDYVNVLDIPKAFSLKYALKKYGIFSRNFFVSALGRFYKHSWNAMPKIKKQYDIAICYSHVKNIKYFTIDNVKANNKYAFYHHGSYEFSGAIKSLDAEYYPKYDRVFAVSNFAKEVLLREFGNSFEIDVCPNLINVDEILKLSKVSCTEMDNFNGLKLLTVGRLSEEKNPFLLIDIAKILAKKKMDFKWFIVGDGILFEELKEKIFLEGLEEYFVLVGNQINPYKFMSRCDAYVQTSKFEADPLTIKEVAIFNKPMFLSDISSFKDCNKSIFNIQTLKTSLEFAENILNFDRTNINLNSVNSLNFKALCTIKKMFEEE